jgi:hypothetical protein
MTCAKNHLPRQPFLQAVRLPDEEIRSSSESEVRTIWLADHNGNQNLPESSHNRRAEDPPAPRHSDKEYGRQVPGGPILCGGWRRLDENQGLGHHEERFSPRVLAGIAGTLVTLFPTLAGVILAAEFSG